MAVRDITASPVALPAARVWLVSIFTLACGPSGVASQFGGGGFGGGYNPPAPMCPAFSCKKGEMPVGKVDHQLWSYGCKESGMSFLNTANFDPSNPLGGLQQKNVDKCCVERDICKQTCGMSSKACHENFQKCSKKICKGDQNCEMQAMLSEIMSEPYDPDEAKDKKFDAEESKCKGYNRGQKESCQCVAKDAWQGATNTKLKAFYSKFNPEKLDKKGEIKDLDDVWKKWKGKESDMFLALATKYKEKAVEIRVKPTPPPYKPPAEESKVGKEEADSETSDTASVRFDSAEEATSAPPSEEATASEDPEGEKFVAKRKELIEKKKKASEEEDYDAAQEYKEELQALTKTEIDRLTSLKKKAIDDEDYRAAKELKARLSKLDL